MPKPFTEKEKELLKSMLKEKGRELFSGYGLKKTSIRELTDAVGIAQGSFYSFYPTKEELYFDILEEEEKRLRTRFLANLQERRPITQKVFKDFLLGAVAMVEESPLLKRLVLEDEMDLLLRKLPREIIEKHIKNDLDVFQSVVKEWQEQGIMVEKNAEAIAGVLQALFILLAHKREIGEKRFGQTLELLTELIASGLIRERGEADHD